MVDVYGFSHNEVRCCRCAVKYRVCGTIDYPYVCTDCKLAEWSAGAKVSASTLASAVGPPVSPPAAPEENGEPIGVGGAVLAGRLPASHKPEPLTPEQFAAVRQRVLHATESCVLSTQQAKELADLCLVRARAADGSPAPPHRCPVCEGRGKVPVDFYDVGRTVAYRSHPFDLPCCRACKGAGVLWR